MQHKPSFANILVFAINFYIQFVKKDIRQNSTAIAVALFLSLQNLEFHSRLFINSTAFAVRYSELSIEYGYIIREL